MRSEMLVKPQARGVPPPARRRSAACGDASAWGLRWGVASTGRAVPCLTPLWCGTAGAGGQRATMKALIQVLLYSLHNSMLESDLQPKKAG